jgi:hypothetical protein
MNVSKAADRGLQARSGIAYLWVAAILAVLASAPALFARDILGGDWTEGIRLTQNALCDFESYVASGPFFVLRLQR